jgi:hypothetical protein
VVEELTLDEDERTILAEEDNCCDAVLLVSVILPENPVN